MASSLSLFVMHSLKRSLFKNALYKEMKGGEKNWKRQNREITGERESRGEGANGSGGK